MCTLTPFKPSAFAISVSARSCVDSAPIAPRFTSAWTTTSAAMRRSREFVPLKISSTRNSTGSGDSMACRRRSTSARNLDFPFNRESVMEREAKIERADNRRAVARTGAPAKASTAFNPMARNRVLFPDMLDPLIT